ncbi:MAG: hypothetical protein E1N59_3264 [Puniceicoccaceae bacterium 5H]|nr:MAG: hypothetical protein E1N59_3264 [Puniceicoccaceae bacterium 5H]
MTLLEYLGVAVIFATLFFFGGAFALYWAKKNNQFNNLEEGSRVIFDEEEPEGQQTDFFPGER